MLRTSTTLFHIHTCIYTRTIMWYDLAYSLSLALSLKHTHTLRAGQEGLEFHVSCAIFPRLLADVLDMKRSQFPAAPRWVCGCFNWKSEISHLHPFSSSYSVHCFTHRHTHTGERLFTKAGAFSLFLQTVTVSHLSHLLPLLPPSPPHPHPAPLMFSFKAAEVESPVFTMGLLTASGHTHHLRVDPLPKNRLA